MPDVIDAVNAGRKCIGAPYVFWGGGDLEALSPEYVDAPGLTPGYVIDNGCNCSGLINALRRFVLGDNTFFAGTEGYGEWIEPWEEWDSSKYYPVGTLLIEPYVEGVSEGHVAIVSKPDQTILQATSWYGGGYPGVTEDRTSWDQATYTPWAWAGFMPDLLPPEQGGPLDPGTGGGTTPTTGKYPGDTATPLQMAAWMSGVAEREFPIVPGILPVMTSCVELRAAWEGPGDVRDVPGYLPPPMDGTSLGWFQQQVGIYADADTPNVAVTQEQVLDPEWSLRSFLRWAKYYSDEKWNERTTDPYELGAWINAAQNSGFPDAYANVGYPMAKALLDQIPAPTPLEDEVTFAKYTFVATQGDHVAVDVTNAAVAALEASGVDCLAFSGTDNIKMAGDAALAVADGEKLNCLVVGQKAYDALSSDARAKAGWVEGGTVWALYGDSDAASLAKVRNPNWALEWIATHPAKDQKPLDKSKLVATFDAILMAIDSKYGDLIAEVEHGDHPPPPPPSPDPGSEQKLEILWADYKQRMWVPHEQGKEGTQ